MSRARNALATNLRRWRRVRQLSINALSQRTGVEGSVIQDLEAGRGFGRVRLGTLEALARGLGIKAATLLRT